MNQLAKLVLVDSIRNCPLKGRRDEATNGAEDTFGWILPGEAVALHADGFAADAAKC